MTQQVNGLTLDTATVPVADLTTYHRNPRRGDVNAIARSLDTLGQFRPLVVNHGTHTGRKDEVLAGNHTLQAAVKLGWATVRACYVDVDDDTCARIVAADNRTSDLAQYDDRLLVELLADLPDLDGTGYDPGDMDDLLRNMTAPTPPTIGGADEHDGSGTDAYAEWQGMPEYESDDQLAYRTIKVHFRSDEDAEAFAALLGQSITSKTKYLWHPAAERDQVTDLAWTTQG